MSSQSGPDQNPPLFARRGAGIFMVGTIAGFLVLIASAGVDRSRRAALETTSETTGVGDQAFVKLAAAPSNDQPPLAVYHGKPLRAASEKVEIRDIRMQRVGQDDAGQFVIYKGREKGKDSEDEERVGDSLYMKLGADAYVKVKPVGDGK